MNPPKLEDEIIELLEHSGSMTAEEVATILMPGRYRDDEAKIVGAVLRKLSYRTQVAYNHASGKWFILPEEDPQ